MDIVKKILFMFIVIMCNINCYCTQDAYRWTNVTLRLSNSDENKIAFSPQSSDAKSKIICAANTISLKGDLSKFNGTTYVQNNVTIKMEDDTTKLPAKININNNNNCIIYIKSNNINTIPTANVNYLCDIAANDINKPIKINDCTVIDGNKLKVASDMEVSFQDVKINGTMKIDCKKIVSNKLDFSQGTIELEKSCNNISAKSMVLGKSLKTIDSENIININVAGELTTIDNAPMEFSFKIDPSNRRNDKIIAATVSNNTNKTISLKEYKVISQINDNNCEYTVIDPHNNNIKLSMEEKIYLDPYTQEKYKFYVSDNKLIIRKESYNNDDEEKTNLVEKEIESIITHSVAKSAMSSATRASSVIKSFDSSEFAESGNINFRDTSILKRSASNDSKELYISYGKYRVWNKCEVGDEVIFATNTDLQNPNISYANSDYRVVCGIDSSPYLTDNGIFCMNSLFSQYMKTSTIENAVNARAQSQHNYMLGGKKTWFTKKWALNLLGSVEIMDSSIEGAKCTGYILNCSGLFHYNLKLGKYITIAPNISLGATKVIVNPIKVENDQLRCYTPVNFAYSVGVDCAYKASNFDVKTMIKNHYSDNNTTKIFRNTDNINNNIQMKKNFTEYGLHFTKQSKKKTSFEFSISKFTGGKKGTSVESTVKTVI